MLWFFCKHGHFWGLMGGGIFFCFFQILLLQKLLLRFKNKKNSIYHISNNFCNFPRGGKKNTKKVQILNFGRLPVGQFSLDFKKHFGFGLLLPISTTYLRSDKIRNVVWPPPLPTNKSPRQRIFLFFKDRHLNQFVNYMYTTHCLLSRFSGFSSRLNEGRVHLPSRVIKCWQIISK